MSIIFHFLSVEFILLIENQEFGKAPAVHVRVCVCLCGMKLLASS